MSRHSRKRFGQHFLIDPEVIQRIVATVNPTPGERLIEIGPGRGALTDALLERGVALQVLEIDRDLVRILEDRYRGCQRLTIIQGDALQADFARLAGSAPYRLVGNLPYNISTPLLFHVLAAAQAPIDMHFMLQKEVVDRLAAAPGGKDYGRLSIMCQNRCEVVPLFDIGRAAFEPPPRVESAFVRLRPLAAPRSGLALLESLDQVVRQAFSKRRKTLRNSLSGMFASEELARLGIDPAQRAEQLTLDQFISLARELRGHRSP